MRVGSVLVREAFDAALAVVVEHVDDCDACKRVGLCDEGVILNRMAGWFGDVELISEAA